ncbi:MAG TPA: ABC transporter permease, partial [Candidatus Binatus sp.]|nr:ABC transporter permease [Candidatus Binatus sp.]
MTGLMQDFRYALRQMRKSPAFFLVVVLTLGLGIGANTAIFSMVDWLVLRTLPIAHPEEMHFLAFSRPGEHSEVEFSYPEFLDIQKQTTDVFSGLTPFIFGGLAGEQNSQSGLTADGTTQAVQTAYVGGDFFSVMGLTPAAGRFILSSEGKAVGADPVVVLSYSYWQNRFSADPAIIGKAVSINGHPVTIIGVAPKGFLGPTPILETQAYLPLSQFMIERGIAGDFLANPKARSMEAIARVKPGAEIKQVQSKLAVVGQHLLKQFPRDRGIGELGASPLRGPGIIAGENPFPKLAALFLILATLVLALACVNVANLFLVRAAARRREMAVRAALGAGSGRLVRQLLTESLVVAALSCILGALLGSAATRLLGSINMQSELPLVFDFAFNWHVFAYAFAVAAFTAAFVVVVPAARVRHGNLREVLHEGGRTSTGGRQRLRDILVAAQVGGSLTLLIVAGLFVRSLRGVQRADLGFDPVHVLNVTLDPNEIGYTEAQGRAFYRAVLERTRALPGVESASLASVVPLSDSVQGSDLAIPGYVTSTDQQAPHAETDAVSPNYFATMRITLKSGRDFTDADNENSSRVVVINQAMADRFWPGQDVLGKSFALTSDLKRPVTIVGVVQNSRMSQLYGVFEPIFYLPVTQSYVSTETLQIRSERNTQDAVAEVRSIAQSLAPAIPLYGVRTMTEALHGGNGLLFFELGASLAAGLGLLGLILAVVGVYGVMSYAVSQRTQEIGVRIALGAQKRDILQMIGSRGAVIVASGLTVGLLAALAV